MNSISKLFAFLFLASCVTGIQAVRIKNDLGQTLSIQMIDETFTGDLENPGDDYGNALLETIPAEGLSSDFNLEEGGRYIVFIWRPGHDEDRTMFSVFNQDKVKSFVENDIINMDRLMGNWTFENEPSSMT